MALQAAGNGLQPGQCSFCVVLFATWALLVAARIEEANPYQLFSEHARLPPLSNRTDRLCIYILWLLTACRSAAAAAAGDHSTAKQLGAEARALKLAADEAHAAAAVKIEVANNAHSSAGLVSILGSSAVTRCLA